MYSSIIYLGCYPIRPDGLRPYWLFLAGLEVSGSDLLFPSFHPTILSGQVFKHIFRLLSHWARWSTSVLIVLCWLKSFREWPPFPKFPSYHHIRPGNLTYIHYSLSGCYPIRPDGLRPYRLFFAGFEASGGGLVMPSSSWRVETQVSIHPENWKWKKVKTQVSKMENVKVEMEKKCPFNQKNKSEKWKHKWSYSKKSKLKSESRNGKSKHRKNCECCPVSLLIVRQQRLSWFQVLNCQNCN